MATAARLLNRDNRARSAFTAIPEHPVEVPGCFSDEGTHAAAVAAQHQNVNHVFVHHGRHSAFDLMDIFGTAQGQPIFNPSNYDWVYEIYRQAGVRGIDTVLTGRTGNFTFSYDGKRALRSLARRGQWLALARLSRNLHHNASQSWGAIAHELLRPTLPESIRLMIDQMRRQSVAMHEYSMINPRFAKQFGVSPGARENRYLHLDSRELRLLFFRQMDMGAAAAALRKLTGVNTTDPCGDQRVVEYCLSVPVEFYCERGIPRSLIRNAMIGKLPECVRTEQRKGLQSADFSLHFQRDRQEALAELQRMKKIDLAVRALDLEKIEIMLQWPDTRIAQAGGMAHHWPRLLRALSLGRFLRRIEDETLFSPPHLHGIRATLSQ